jgi:two-component sensor histidine kinase
VQEGWHGASLHELVRSQLGHYLDREEPPVTFGGPAILLKPEAAQALGLGLHELATNAAKYGALSTPRGRVNVSWKRLPASDGNGIEIVWREQEGPTVSAPTRRGFGSTVIERHVAKSLDADVELRFEPEGVRCRFVVPVTQFVAAR